MSEEIDVIVTPELTQDLLAKHGKPLKAIKTKAGVFVLKRVSREQWKKYREMSLNTKTQEGAPEWLARAATVFPDPKEVHERIKVWPAIANRMANEASRLAGFEDEDEAEGKDLGD